MLGVWRSLGPGANQQATLEYANLNTSPIQRKAVVSLRAPDQSLLSQQLDLVAAYADLCADRAAEIVAQVTPPIAFWSAIVGPSHIATKDPSTAGSLPAAVDSRRDALQTHLRRAAPDGAVAQIQPMIPTPGHGALPSGHRGFHRRHRFGSAVKRR
ncbi:MAG: hypothetical protein U5N27_22670 [Rhizobium sp.]|nr:hypothetical protein [Rhizobium sp.]